MKIIKAILLTLILSFCFTMSAQAIQYFWVYSVISIPNSASANGYTDGDYLKENTVTQTMETWSTNRAAQALLRKTNAATWNSGWRDVPVNQVVSFGSGSTTINGLYRIQLKSKNVLLGATYSGIWKINM